ncbi:hypothetical protein KCP70_18615 [Salmonella enterica subsp. enterica]|nr:hypothetical protein KCP70_18615 [Salmonella enterica subsp. enterica]
MVARDQLTDFLTPAAVPDDQRPISSGVPSAATGSIAEIPPGKLPGLLQWRGIRRTLHHANLAVFLTPRVRTGITNILLGKRCGSRRGGDFRHRPGSAPAPGAHSPLRSCCNRVNAILCADGRRPEGSRNAFHKELS